MILEDFGSFLARFWSNFLQILSAFYTFLQNCAELCRILQILRDFCTSWPIPASLCRALGHGLGWPLPREAAPLKNPRNINDFQWFSSVCRKGRPRPRGLGRSLLPRAAVDFLRKIRSFLHISADFCIFLCGNMFNIWLNLVIIMKYHEYSWNFNEF